MTRCRREVARPGLGGYARRISLLALFSVLCCSIAWGSAQAQNAEHGKYLAVTGDCAVCHTATGGGHAQFAGGYPLHAIFGTVYSTNITPDKATGIGSWTSDQFYHALTDGVAPHGRYLYPAFPYVYFARVSRADSNDIFAYLHSLKPVHYQPPADRLIFPADIRLSMFFWDLLFFHPGHPPATKPSRWNTGYQLVNGLGHCGGCHTPKNFFFADDSGRAFQGETIDGWYAPNLTGSPRTGLGRWSAADIIQYLKTGSNKFGKVVGSMQDIVRVSTSHMSNGDLVAIATYLKSLPAAPEPAVPAPDPRAMRDGQTVFVERCSVCHQPADARDYPPLAGNAVIQNPDPTTLIHVVLQGSQSAPTANAPIGFSMPAFPVMSNRELADVLTYIRNSWGNRAGAVSEKQAAEIRGLLNPKG